METTIKTCSKCNETKPMTAEYFRPRKDSKDGYRNQCLKCLRGYHRKHTQEWRADNQEKVIEYRKQYKKINPIKIRIDKQKRRTLKQNLLSTLTTKQYIETLTHFNNSCAYCGMTQKEHIKTKNHRLHQDHFIPLLKNGEYTKSNILPSCQSCNCSKGDRDFQEWYPEYEHYNQEREKVIIKYIEHNN